MQDGWMGRRLVRDVAGAVTTSLAAVSIVLALAGASFAAEPVKHISIYVEPFYRAGRTPEEPPEVGTGKPHAELLASLRREDILTARDAIAAKPRLVTPMTLMVLAIRLYDVGLRDEAVFWFYVAKERYIALSEVIVAGTPLLQQADQAMRAFSALAGPVINGYAFCDIAKQRDQHARALSWVERNPYEAVFIEQLPARSPDRQAALERALRAARESAAKEIAFLDDPKKREAFLATRKTNHADEMYCWD